MRQKHDESYSQYCNRIEKSLLKRKPIKLEGVEVIPPGGECKSTIYEILKLSYSSNTIYCHNSNTQCWRRRYRSQGDLFLIAKYYYPNITFQEVRSELFSLLENELISTLFCHDILKRVFYFRSYYYFGTFHGDEESYDIRRERWEDEYGLFPHHLK